MKILSRSEMKNLIGGQKDVGGITPYDCKCSNGKYAGVNNCNDCTSYCKTHQNDSTVDCCEAFVGETGGGCP